MLRAIPAQFRGIVADALKRSVGENGRVVSGGRSPWTCGYTKCSVSVVTEKLESRLLMSAARAGPAFARLSHGILSVRGTAGPDVIAFAQMAEPTPDGDLEWFVE